MDFHSPRSKRVPMSAAAWLLRTLALAFICCVARPLLGQTITTTTTQTHQRDRDTQGDRENDAGIADTGIDDEGNNPSGPPSSGITLFVDNTPLDGDCPQAKFVTIQAAVNASGPNDTIKVCPGTYPEQVVISGRGHDGLRLVSLQPLAATIKWPVAEVGHQLIDISGADGVIIRGFTISGPFTWGGCALDRHEGVLFENAFKGRLDHNHITLIRNNDPLLWGCQEGDAVAIGRSLAFPMNFPASARIDHNAIDRYQKNGVQAVNNGTSANVQDNTISYFPDEVVNGVTVRSVVYRAAPNGVLVFSGAAARVENNVISGNQWTTPLSIGIILDEAPSRSSQVDHNSIFKNDFGIETDTQMGLEISHNRVFNNVSDAITLCGDATRGCGPATQNIVKNNNITNNGGGGILLLGAVSNLLNSNQIVGNGARDLMDGIRVDSKSVNNQLFDNHMENNVAFDCGDESTGSGTARTANNWVNNAGDTQNRPGLCRSAMRR